MRFFIFATLAVSIAWAAPGPPQSLVNEKTKQCTQAMLADDFSTCRPLAPWKIAPCPKDYRFVKDAKAIRCEPYPQNPDS